MNKINKYLNNPKYVFHGSNQRFNIVSPQPTKRIDINGKITYEGISIHATPELYIALSYTYDKLKRPYYFTGVSLFDSNNSIFVYGQKSLDYSLQQLWPENYYGYIYVLDAENFFWKDGLGPLEVISYDPIKPIKIFKIKNITKLFKKLGTNIYFKRSPHTIE
ncbi:hypothetical protein QJ856_gp0882 [Tupanvirus deep ocean]|uniref:Uncharacterized protein n=2 Tax=Tupanvirus TaxID=2094720 RepID=A0AC62A827_9VIRU|nr:hypothetical protein QJ856_gp0882 [Tupanvirus deep ocean]QKU33874.1 hypothetical protein [Tupanvirus deep ocean]